MDRLTFYRDKTAMEFQPVRSERPCVFAKFATALYSGRPEAGKAKFGWKEGINLALNKSEVVALSHGCFKARLLSTKVGDPVWRTYHKFQEVGKTMRLSLAKGSDNFTAWISAKFGDRIVSVGLTDDDLYMLEKLLPFAASAIMGWTTSDIPDWQVQDPQLQGDQDVGEVFYPEEESYTTTTAQQEYWDEIAPPEEVQALGLGAVAKGKIINIWEDKIKNMDGPPSEGQLRLLRWQLEAVFKPDPEARRMAGVVLKNVFNADSSTELDKPMVAALLTWILKERASRDDPLVFNQGVPEEARAIAVMTE